MRTGAREWLTLATAALELALVASWALVRGGRFNRRDLIVCCLLGTAALAKLVLVAVERRRRAESPAE